MQGIVLSQVPLATQKPATTHPRQRRVLQKLIFSASQWHDLSQCITHSICLDGTIAASGEALFNNRIPVGPLTDFPCGEIEHRKY